MGGEKIFEMNEWPISFGVLGSEEMAFCRCLDGIYFYEEDIFCV